MAESDWANIVEEWPPRGSAQRAMLAEPFRRAWDQTPGRKPVLVARLGDSRSTHPAAAARFIDNALAAYFLSVYGNMPGSPLVSGSNATVATGGYPSAVCTNASGAGHDPTIATYTPPGVLGRAWLAGDANGTGETGSSIMYSPSWAACNPYQPYKGSKLVDRATARMSIRHYCYNKDPDQGASGQITWRLSKNDLVDPALSFASPGTLLGNGVTSMALDGAGVYVRDELISNSAFTFGANLGMTLRITGSHATNFCQWIGSRFECYNAPQGVLFDSFGASGYKFTSWNTNHPNFGTFFATLNPDCYILWFGANDAGQNVLPATFYTDAQAMVGRIRAISSKPIWLIGDYYRGGLNPTQLGYLDQYPAQLLALAKQTHNCGFYNLRKKTQALGWSEANNPSVAGAVDWTHGNPYTAGTSIVRLPGQGALFDYYICIVSNTADSATNKPSLELLNSNLCWRQVTSLLDQDLVHVSPKGAEVVARILGDALTSGANQPPVRANTIRRR